MENKKSGSKNKWDFHLWKNTGTFLGALDYMVEQFYVGDPAEEIRLLLLDKKREFSSSFVRQVVGGDHKEVRRYDLNHLNDEEQIDAFYYIGRDDAIFDLLLQLHHIGKSNLFIQAKLKKLGYRFPEKFIRDVITAEEKWDEEDPMRHDVCEEDQLKEEQSDEVSGLKNGNDSDLWVQSNEVSGLSNGNDYDLWENSGEFFGALKYMVKAFYFGQSTEETRLLFQLNKREFSYSFIEQVVGGDHTEVKSFDLLPEEQIEATYHMERDIAVFDLLLQLHGIGKNAAFIHQKLRTLGYRFSEDFIQDMIDYEEQWDQNDPLRLHVCGLEQLSLEKQSDMEYDWECTAL